jgi:Z1 domain/Type III restriction enzyme, res subunit
LANSTQFNIDNFRGSGLTNLVNSRYEKQIERVRSKGQTTAEIEKAVEATLANLSEHGSESFVIYGEPQSGKTEMMICTAAALLDQGRKIIVVLVNDSVQLLEQNLSRFQRSGIDPAPKNFSEILDNTVKIGDREWIVFCKKNQSDLQKLNEKLRRVAAKVVIDDEADYASPNSKVNRAQKTRINELVEELIGQDGVYIGVTATPARLDLNLTFDNENEHWVDFPAHPKYTGQDVFFPIEQDALDSPDFRLTLLGDNHDDERHLRTALFGFIINVSFLNWSGTRRASYSMLIHTSGKKADHTVDYQIITRIFGALADQASRRYESYARELFAIAEERYGEDATEILQFALTRINQNNIVVMNSDSDRHQATYEKATNPATLFTVVIGGNIVSRGVTFDNLLSMFFTRDSAHRIQQDTYIQRARMFGARGDHLKWFELTIPRGLYFDWQRCFVFHRLSLSGIRGGFGAPIWLGDTRVKPVTGASIKQSAVVWKSGEMYWEKFSYTDHVASLIGDGGKGLKLVQDLAEAVGEVSLPRHVLDFITNFLPYGDDSVAVHGTQLVTSAYQSADAREITREKGFIGTGQLERAKYPRAIHHVKLFRNEDGEARVYYKYAPDQGDLRVNGRRLSFIARDQ